MEELLIGIVSMILILSLIPLFLWKRRQLSSSSSHQQLQQVPDDDDQVPIRENVVRGSATRRMRRRPAAAASSSSSAPVEDNIEGSDEDEGAYNVAKGSKKKEKKRQEREAQRQAEEAVRESRLTKQDRYSEMRRKKDEEREAQERQLEVEAMARKAKEEEAAALEFDKWKGEFSIDAEGTTENELQDESRGLLFDFVEYIKDCINRITSLESMGRLSGVMDDRGKYIYISQEEMKAVADYIKRQGRVSISHLASQSNQFIDLEPKIELVDQIGNSEGIAVA
ncbi:hypothetical protein AQUCO_01200128v1 [Aquilegia coerulea]|uniref:DDRGK domain-containing protein 1 n=1 Tax=Aquilegia coerulea TaxID=218851 RepID=A0A2G5E4M3_AQUCA|nr:hypothetical protein AQUCO_01200128v1 [Aquilegia coerulea]